MDFVCINTVLIFEYSINKMEIKNNYPKIGEGIFLVRDIAKILNLPTSKIRRWLNEFWNKRFSNSTYNYSFGDKGNEAVNFYTLIEFITFSALRNNNISAQHIQKFHQYLTTKLKTPFPFATTKISTDQVSVYYETFNEYVKYDGKNQISLKKILEPFLLKIDFNQENIAERYFPLGKDHSIVIDPKHQFGQPTIFGTNIKVDTIYSLYKAEESKKTISFLYNLTFSQIDDVIAFCGSRPGDIAA